MDEQERHGESTASRKKGGMSGKSGKSDTGLTIIGIGKLIKVVTLVTVGIAALVAVNHDPPKMLEHVANFMGVDHNSRHLQRLVSGLAGVSPKKLGAIGFGSFVYAALFAVEGIGLLMKKRWAEYLTVVITTSFIPLEIYELVRHFSAAKVIALGLNVIVVVYLLVRLRRERHDVNDVNDRDRGRRPGPAQLGIASR